MVTRLLTTEVKNSISFSMIKLKIRDGLVHGYLFLLMELNGRRVKAFIGLDRLLPKWKVEGRVLMRMSGDQGASLEGLESRKQGGISSS